MMSPYQALRMARRPPPAPMTENDMSVVVAEAARLEAARKDLEHAMKLAAREGQR